MLSFSHFLHFKEKQQHHTIVHSLIFNLLIAHPFTIGHEYNLKKELCCVCLLKLVSAKSAKAHDGLKIIQIEVS